MNVSQCNGGTVMQGRYETSKHLAVAGVISGGDITTEAAVTKMMFVLGQHANKADIVRMLSEPVRGEMS
jgi:L-asparaginase